MSAKEYSILIEKLLRIAKGPSYRKSDEIMLDPYKEIVSALEYEVSQEELDWFKMCYQAIRGQGLQELINENYDIEKIICDLRKLIENK